MWDVATDKDHCAILVCRGTPGQSVEARGGFTTTLDLGGNAGVIRQLTSSNPLLALKIFKVSGEGRRAIEGSEHGCVVRIRFDRATAAGQFGEQPFEFEVSPVKPENFAEDKAVEIAWGMAMAGRHYVLGPKGEYWPGKADVDAHGEAMAILVDAPVRLPDGQVCVGQEWTTEWDGSRTHKDTGARFRYRQNAVLQELTDGPTRRAQIAFSTFGTLQFPDQPSPQREEAVLEAKGTIVLDLDGGLPVMLESAGMITRDLKQAGVKIVRSTSARFDLSPSGGE